MPHLKLRSVVIALCLLPFSWSCSVQNNNLTPLNSAVELSYDEPNLTQDLTLSQEIKSDILPAEKPQEELTPPEPDQTLAQEVQDLEKLMQSG